MNEQQVQVKTPEYVSLQFQPAGLGSRGAALIIDYLVLSVLNAAVVLLMALAMKGQDVLRLLDNSSVPMAMAILLLFVINWGYFFVFEYFSGGRTIGKKLLGLRVIQDNGHSITLLSSFIRNFMRIIDMLPMYYFIGMITVFFHSRHKRIGDMVAGTLVVHERKAKRKKKTPYEKEIERRNIAKANLQLDGAHRSLGSQEWKLVKTYVERFLQLSLMERSQLTRELSTAIFPKVGFEIEGKTDYDLENILLALYLHLKDEWEYEM